MWSTKKTKPKITKEKYLDISEEKASLLKPERHFKEPKIKINSNSNSYRINNKNEKKKNLNVLII